MEPDGDPDDAQPDAAVQPDIFRETLEATLDPRHELLADRLGAARCRTATRPISMAGLHVLKHMKGLSDEAVCAAWVETPYFQAFCGERFFKYRLTLAAR
jgi:transposase, IS5 family